MAGVLTDIFDGAAAKYLSAVEVDRFVSHQHEFNGVASFRAVFGEAGEPVRFPATYYWLEDEEDGDPAIANSSCTWSDVRRWTPDRTEYRLYYPTEADSVVRRAAVGDLLILVKEKTGRVLFVLCRSGTTIENQLLWLFGLSPTAQMSDSKDASQIADVPLGFAAWSVLEDLGVGLVDREPDVFDQLIERFGMTFPTTAMFSKFARDTLAEVDVLVSPDGALVAWMDHEEALFRHMERHVVGERLRQGFVEDGDVDVDSFTKFSLSVHNRRKSRAGWALSNHLEVVFDAHDIKHKREAVTEGKKKPDFLFPGEAEYSDETYGTGLLTMLGAKRTCKDRWRQVLSEANRIADKHLITLEPSISTAQTEEMKAADLQLVVPRELFGSYDLLQQDWLIDLSGFIDLVKQRQPA